MRRSRASAGCWVWRPMPRSPPGPSKRSRWAPRSPPTRCSSGPASGRCSSPPKASGTCPGSATRTGRGCSISRSSSPSRSSSGRWRSPSGWGPTARCWSRSTRRWCGHASRRPMPRASARWRSPSSTGTGFRPMSSGPRPSPARPASARFRPATRSARWSGWSRAAIPRPSTPISPPSCAITSAGSPGPSGPVRRAAPDSSSCSPMAASPGRAASGARMRSCRGRPAAWSAWPGSAPGPAMKN